MFNKIQPQQIELHTFSSPSGNFTFEQNESEVKINLYSGLTGSFQIDGALFVNGGSASSYHASNTVGGLGTSISHGRGNFVSGTDSLAGGANHLVSGTRNAVLNGNQGQILDTVADGTIVAGYGGFINNSHNGAVLITDATIATKSSKGVNTLLLEFDNGTFVQSDLNVEENLHIGGSGLASGDFHVLGTMLYTGAEVTTMPVMSGYVSGISGNIQANIDTLSGFTIGASGSLLDTIVATGEELNRRIKLDVDDLVRQTGNQIISGNKEFWDGIKIGGESLIQGTGVVVNSIILEDDLAVTMSSGNNLTISSTDSILCLLDHNGDGAGGVANDFSSVWDNSFVVATGSNDPDTARVAFAVHPSGIAYVRDTLIIESPRNIPATSASDGIQGEMKWERISADISYSYLHNGTEWHRFSGGAF